MKVETLPVREVPPASVPQRTPKFLAAFRLMSMILAWTKICRVGRLPRLTRSTTLRSGGRDWIRRSSGSRGVPSSVRLGVASFRSIRGALSPGTVSGVSAPLSLLLTRLGFRALRARAACAGALEGADGSVSWEAY